MNITEPRRSRGRPTAEINSTIVGALALKGLCLADTAKALGVTRQCLHARFKADVELRVAYQVGAQAFRDKAMGEAADIVAAMVLVRAALKAARTTAAV